MTELTLPWPPKELLPNNRNGRHWGSIQGPKSKYQQWCYLAALETHPELPEGQIRLLIQFYPPDKRKRDDDGMVGAFKAGRDGVAKAWGIDDNRFRCTYEICDPVKYGKVVVQIMC